MSDQQTVRPSKPQQAPGGAAGAAGAQAKKSAGSPGKKAIKPGMSPKQAAEKLNAQLKDQAPAAKKAGGKQDARAAAAKGKKDPAGKDVQNSAGKKAPEGAGRQPPAQKNGAVAKAPDQALQENAAAESDLSALREAQEMLPDMVVERLYSADQSFHFLRLVMTLAFFIGLIAVAGLLCIEKLNDFSKEYISEQIASDAQRMSVLTTERVRMQYAQMHDAADQILYARDQRDIDDSVRSITHDEGSYAGLMGYDGTVAGGRGLDMLSYPEISQVFHGLPQVGYYPDLGMLFVYPVIAANGNVRYALYKVIKPMFLDGFALDGYRNLGEAAVRCGDKFIVNPKHGSLKLAEMLSQAQTRHGFMQLAEQRRTSLSGASVITGTDGATYFIYEADVPDSPFLVTGYVKAEELLTSYRGVTLILELIGGLLMLIFSAGGLYILLSARQSWDLAAGEARGSVSELVAQVRESAYAFISGEVTSRMGRILDLDYRILDKARDFDILKFAGSIRRAGVTLLSVLNNLLDFARAQSGRLEVVREEYELSTMIDDLVSEASSNCVKKDLKFSVNVSPRIPGRLLGDAVRIRQIVSNLLDNAVKFTARGYVAFSVTGDVSEDQKSVMLRFKVSDTGPGVTDEERERFFSQFAHNMGAAVMHRGKGLGLALCYSLLKLMNGFIDIQSVPGKGSVFTAAVPQAIVSLEPIGDYAERARMLERQRDETFSSFTAPQAKVLVVDDNDMSLKLIAKMLGHPQVGADLAHSGQECLQQLCRAKYDAVFLDEHMPGMDGVTTLASSKEMLNNLNRDTPVILMTGNNTATARSQAMEAGFTDVLVKPVDHAPMESLLRRYLPKEKISVVKPAQTDFSALSPDSLPGSDVVFSDGGAEPVMPQQNDAEIDAGTAAAFSNNGPQQMFSDSGVAVQRPEVNNDPGPSPVTRRNAVLDDPSLKTLDVDAGLKFCKDDLSLYMRFAGTFCKMHSGRREKMDRAMQVADWKTYVSLMHALRTTSRSIGGTRLSHAAEVLENAAQAIMRPGVSDSDKQQEVYYINDHHQECMQLYDDLVKEAHSSMNV